MELTLQDRPMIFSGQYVDTIEKCKLYYNPLGHGGVTIVDMESQKLLSLCDATHTIEQIIQLDGRSKDVVIDEINTLALREVIGISEQFTQNIHDHLKSTGEISCWMHLTNNCNLACSYCYIHKSPGNMSIETAQQTIDRLIQSCRIHNIKKINIKLAGGEPLLRFDLIQYLVDYAQKVSNEIKITFTLLTNGTLITEQIANYLKCHSIGVGVSLDGIGPINDICRYDKKGCGSYSRVVYGLNILKELGITPSIMTTVSTSNYRDLLDLTKFVLDGEYRFRFSLERDCESGWPKLLDCKSELIESLHKCYDYIEGHLPKKDFTNLHTFGDVSFKRPAKKSCGAGSNFFSIGHDGKLGVCGLGLVKPFSTIEVCDDVLGHTRINNPELATNLASNYPVCNNCYWRKSCAGGCPLQTKSTYSRYDRPSPYCEVYKKILPRVLRIKGIQMIRGLEPGIS